MPSLTIRMGARTEVAHTCTHKRTCILASNNCNNPDKQQQFGPRSQRIDGATQTHTMCAHTLNHTYARTHVHTNRHAYEPQITDMTTTNSDIVFLGERESTA